MKIIIKFMNRLHKIFGSKTEPELFKYLDSIKDKLEIVTTNTHYMRDFENDSGFWIRLPKGLVANIAVGSNKYKSTYTFSYKGNLILQLCIDIEYDYVSGYLPTKLINYNHHNTKENTIFNNHKYGKIYNKDYNMEEILVLVQKCFEAIYKKALVCDKKRLIIENNKTKEVKKQKEIREKRKNRKVKDFILNY
jgi:hypothetical protein